MRMAKGQISLHPSSLKDINAGDQASLQSLTTKEISNKLKRKRRPQDKVNFPAISRLRHLTYLNR